MRMCPAGGHLTVDRCFVDCDCSRFDIVYLRHDAPHGSTISMFDRHEVFTPRTKHHPPPETRQHVLRLIRQRAIQLFDCCVTKCILRANWSGQQSCIYEYPRAYGDSLVSAALQYMKTKTNQPSHRDKKLGKCVPGLTPCIL